MKKTGGSLGSGGHVIMKPETGKTGCNRKETHYSVTKTAF